MNREIEERIVAMYFDNQEFEKSAKQTIDTLGQLKQGLNLEESAKGFNIFEKIGKTLNFDKANEGAKKLKLTMSNLTAGMSKALNIGEAPVRALENTFGAFRNYLTKFIGFDLAGKVVSTVEQTLRGLTIAPVSAGWNQYQNKMDDVKTIMSGTGESIEVVERHLNNLTEYANKTIYSLSDMTSNLGKFTNNGVKLEDATIAMQGIANAAADAGQGAQQASMAMYNISQAIGVGKMTTIDWKSIENANMATTRLKNTFLELAAARGKVDREVDKDGTAHFFLSKDEDGKKLKKKIELTTSNFREYLQKGWLTSDVLVDALRVYSGELNDLDLLESMGITDPEVRKNFLEIGQDALEAAQQVRTFNKMLDALKESVQSGWADSFQLIFGNMEESTTLWTRLNDEIDSVLSGQSKRRNLILKQWTQMSGFKDASGRYLSVYKDSVFGYSRDESLKSGPEILQDSFFELIGVIKEFGSVVSDAFHSVFGQLDASKLMDMTIGFQNIVRNVKEWLGSAEDSESRLSKISRILKGVFSVVKVGINLIKSGFQLVKKLAAPIFDWLLDWFSVIGDFLTGAGDLNLGGLFSKIGEGFTKLWDKIKQIFTPADIGNGKTELPIITWIKQAWSKLKKAVHDWAYDNGLGSLIEGIESFKNTVLGWSVWQDIADFFTNAETTIVNAWNEVKSWGIWKDIGDFLDDTWGWIKRLLGFHETKEGILGENPLLADKRGGFLDLELQENDRLKKDLQHSSGEVTAPLVQFIHDAWETIQNAWNSTIGSEWAKTNLWEPIGTFFTDTWNWICTAVGTATAFFTEPDDQTGKTGFAGWIEGVWANIQSVWQSVTAWTGWQAIGTFFTDTWNWIVRTAGVVGDWFTKPDGDTGKTGFVSWLEETWHSVEDFWNNTILGTARPIWEAIAKFGSDTWNWILEQFSPTESPVQKRKDELIESLSLTPEFRNTQTGRTKSPVEIWLGEVWEGVKTAWDSVVGWEGWGAIGNFMSDTWGWITGLFNGGESGAGASTAGASPAAVKKSEKNAEALREAVQEDGILTKVFDAVGGFFERVMTAVNGVVIDPTVTTFITKVFDFLKEVFNVFSDVIGSIGKLIHGVRTGDFSNWTSQDTGGIITVAIGLIATIVAKILTFKNNANLAKIGGMDSFGKQFLEIAGGLMLMAAAVALISTIDSTKLGPAVGTVVSLGFIVGAVIAAIAALKHESTVAAPVTSSERILNNLINTIGKVGIIATALKLLPGVVKAFGEAKAAANGSDIGKDILDTFLGLSAFIGAVSLSFALVQKITGNQGLDPAATGKTALSIVEIIAVIAAVALAIGGIGGLFDKIAGEGSSQAALDALDRAGDFLNHLGAAIGDFFRGLFGIKSDKEKAEESLEIFDMLREYMDVFDMQKISGISRMMTLLQRITDGSVKFDSGKLSDFSTAMGNLGSGIYEIASHISEVEGPLAELDNPDSVMYRRLKGFTDFGKQLGEVLTPFASTSFYMGRALNQLHELATKENSEQLVNDLNVMLRALGGLDDPQDGIQFDGLTIATKLFDAIQQGLLDPSMPAFDATSVVTAITLALTNGNEAIAQIVHDMVQSGIDLNGKAGGANGYTIDWSQFNIDKLTSGETIDVGGLIDTTGFESKLFGEDGKGGLLGSFTSFQDQIPSVDELFSGKGWMDFKDENGKDIDIFGEMQTQLDGLGAQLSEMDPLKVTITPVFSMENFTPDKLQEKLDKLPIRWAPATSMNQSVTLDFTGIGEELGMQEIKTKLDEIRNAINAWGLSNMNSTDGLAEHMDGISDEISSMQMVLDSGVLVGQMLPQIDAGLYQRSVAAGRTGVVSMIK